MAAITLRAYSCRVDGYDHETIVNAPTAGKARYQHWLDVRDAIPELPLTAIRVRSFGAPRTSQRLREIGTYRHLPLEAGDRVEVRGMGGATVGDAGGGGARFLVWFDATGKTGYVHPCDLTRDVTRLHDAAKEPK